MVHTEQSWIFNKWQKLLSPVVAFYFGPSQGDTCYGSVIRVPVQFIKCIVGIFTTRNNLFIWPISAWNVHKYFRAVNANSRRRKSQWIIHSTWSHERSGDWHIVVHYWHGAEHPTIASLNQTNNYCVRSPVSEKVQLAISRHPGVH